MSPPKNVKTAAPKLPLTLSALAADPDNARDITPAAMEGLKYSLEEFGDISGIVFNSRTGELVCGHQRVQALIDQHGDRPVAALDGLGGFRVRVVDWDRKKQRAANIAANNPHIAGHFTKGLQAQLAALAAADEEMFKALRLEELVLDDEVENPGKTGVDEAPDPPVTPKSKRGEIYELGKHRLGCGAAEDLEFVKLLMAGAEADLIVTDPPYNVDYTGKTKKALKIENDKAAPEEFLAKLKAWFDSMFAVARLGCSIYVYHADSEGENFRRAYREAGFALKQTLIWVKDVFVMGRQDHQWQHEPILYGWKEGAAHSWFGGRKRSTLLEHPRPKRSDVHPTMKPVDMLADLLRCSSRPGGLVLDLFGGSGSTLIACEKTRRVCRTLELDPRYVDVIIQRWEEFTGKKAVRVNTGLIRALGPEGTAAYEARLEASGARQKVKP